MEKKEKIKIFVSHHKQGRVFKSDIVCPIQVGTSLSKTDLNLLKDNTGENISEKNDRYCELTAQYWAWKNVDADYYGFMHYRRHFVFNEIPEYPDDGGLLHFLEMDKEYIEKIGLNDEAISRAVSGTDIILPPEVDLSGWCAPSNEIQYGCLNNLHVKDFVTVCDKITELYPEYEEAVETFRKDSRVYWYNMFIMRKEIFLDYSKWLFTILEESENSMDFDLYDTQERRTLAFMAERLLSIYILHLRKNNPRVSIKHLKITFLHHTDIEPFDLSGKNNVTEPSVEFLDWLNNSLKRACREIGDINRLPATDTDRLKEGVKCIDSIKSRRLILYGAGNFGRRIRDTLAYIGINVPIEIWDMKKAGQIVDGIEIAAPRFDTADFSNATCIITIADKGISDSVKYEFERNGAGSILTKDEFMSMSINYIWNRLCEDYSINGQ